MTRYAIDERRGELAASWGAGYGDLVTAVAALPVGSTPKQRLTVAATLTTLSDALWRCYTHPASASHSTDVNTEGWRRQHHRASFNLVLEIVQKPNLPDESGILIVSYDPVEECAHGVGRALHAIDDPELTAAVVADLHTEIAAVEQAELGDLSGRAHQAVGLTRTDASPVQIVEADRVLSADPLGSERLFLDFDPTAAAVAAAHWLRAAADVASEASGIAVTDVLVEADKHRGAAARHTDGGAQAHGDRHPAVRRCRLACPERNAGGRR